MFGLFQLDRGDSDSASCDGDAPSEAAPSSLAAPRADGLDLSQIFFSNEEYARKLEELKEAHLRTMADLESRYQQKLHLRPSLGPEAALLDPGPRWAQLDVS